MSKLTGGVHDQLTRDPNNKFASEVTNTQLFCFHINLYLSLNQLNNLTYLK